MTPRRVKGKTWWALKLPNGQYQTDITGHPWIFTDDAKTDHRKWAGGGIKWAKVKLVEVKP